MILELDDDVRRVAEYMQSHVAATRLVSVSLAVSELAPILWGTHPRESVRALSLTHGQACPTGSELLQSASTGSERRGHADGGFEVAGDAA